MKLNKIDRFLIGQYGIIFAFLGVSHLFIVLFLNKYARIAELALPILLIIHSSYVLLRIRRNIMPIIDLLASFLLLFLRYLIVDQIIPRQYRAVELLLILPVICIVRCKFQFQISKELSDEKV